MNFYHLGVFGDIFSPDVLMLSPVAPTKQPIKPMKDAPAAACHDRSLPPTIHIQIPMNKTRIVLR